MFKTTLIFAFLVAAVVAEDQYSVIQHYVSNLVLDATERTVTLQPYDPDNPAQLWLLEPTATGQFLINNKANKLLLDAGGSTLGADIITYTKFGTSNQLWYINYDGSIVTNISSDKHFAISVQNNTAVKGAKLISSSVDGSNDELFVVLLALD